MLVKQSLVVVSGEEGLVFGFHEEDGGIILFDVIAERQAAAERKAESLTMWLKNALDGKKFKTEKAEVNFRKTQKVEVIDIWELNEDFVKYSDPTPDKAAIKRAIKAGEEVNGAKLIDDISVSIK